MVIGKIISVGFLAVRIPLAGPHALAADRFDAQSRATNSCKQIDETKVRLGQQLSPRAAEDLLQGEVLNA